MPAKKQSKNNLNTYIVQQLLTWFKKNKRNLPWRNTKNSYKIWISEIMLQQTQVKQAIPYYKRFLKKFPTIRDVAAAHLDDILKVWEGLGYYRRARYIHESSKIIVDKFNGKIPKDYATLKTLPGFGPYTCGAVLSIAFELPYPAVDGNVIRVISRLFRIESDINVTETKNKITSIVKELIPTNSVSQFTQGLMEMGAIICKPIRPNCNICCWKTICHAYNELPNPETLPKKRKKIRGKHFHIAAGIVQKRNNVLLSKRPEKLILGNLWEFPGGKTEKKETLRGTCKRELYNKTGIDVKIGKKLMTIKHKYSHYDVTIHFFKCSYLKGVLKKPNVKWVHIDDLRNYAFSKVHKQVMLKITGADS